MIEVATRPAIDANTCPLVEGPDGDLHNARESDIHKVDSQNVFVARNKGEMSKELKFNPDDVNMALPDDGIRE